ncbi:MAG: cytochrome c biogenesis protein CcdA [Pseudomonadales bacterium]|nr:cytochrome c biogenesis protein CcdA [Pseudomonadales bacterium]
MNPELSLPRSPTAGRSVFAQVPLLIKAALAALIALGLASTWLIFPYYVEGDGLLNGAGESSRQMKGGEVSRYFSRTLLKHPDLEITATFATEEFFQYVDDASTIRNLRPDRNFVFYVNETVHAGRLPQELPKVILNMGDLELTPVVSSGPVSADHHRVTLYSFPKQLETGQNIALIDYPNIRLSVSNLYLDSPQALTFLGMWEAPYVLPEALRDSSRISMLAMMALGAGLLSSVLTPCLLQMMVVFGSITAGFATVPGAQDGDADYTPVVRRKLMFTASAFVIGFIVMYVLAGALIGSLGFRAQLLFAEYRESLSFVAGTVVLLMAFWVLLRSNKALVCRIPAGRLQQVTNSRDTIASSIMAIGTALGCTVCFGGAIVGTLIIYVGVIGSALIGAGIMLVFALGFALPLLVAAYSLSLSQSFLKMITTYSKTINYLSAALIATFGVILMTDNFHVVSDMIYPYLGLNQ